MNDDDLYRMILETIRLARTHSSELPRSGRNQCPIARRIATYMDTIERELRFREHERHIVQDTRRHFQIEPYYA